MRERIEVFAGILIGMISVLPAFSLEYEENGLRLNLNEENGNFRLSDIQNVESVVYFFSDSDPSTSGLYIYEDNEFYSLSASLRYKGTFSPMENGGVYTWTSKKLAVIEKITLETDGFLHMETSITNISEVSVRSGLKLLIDTSSRENTYTYEIPGTSLPVSAEWENSANDEAVQWEADIAGTERRLVFQSDVEGPERTIIANWDRLEDSGYSYKSVPGRNFSNAPYSINDSAVLELFGPSDILPGNSLVFSFRLGSPIDSVIASEDAIVQTAVSEESPEDPAEPETLLEKTGPVEVQELPAEEQSSGSHLQLIDRKLETMHQISVIMEMLSRPGMITDSNISRLEELIDELEVTDSDENRE